MQVNPLEQYAGVDLVNNLVHMTFRRQNPNDIALPQEIASLAPSWRLASILHNKWIRPFHTYGAAAPVVCLSEAVPRAISLLVAKGRYKPWGAAFSRNFVFQQGGGPCFYVRGDEWPSIASLPGELRARCVRFWPGAQPSAGDELLATHVTSQSEWIHEREWRCVGDGGLHFELADVQFLVLQDLDSGTHPLDFLARCYAELGGQDDLLAEFGERHVVLSTSGDIVNDLANVWV